MPPDGENQDLFEEIRHDAQGAHRSGGNAAVDEALEGDDQGGDAKLAIDDPAKHP